MTARSLEALTAGAVFERPILLEPVEIMACLHGRKG
jgi:hypothetical protein